MDFQLSYQWLKEFVDVRVPPERLAELLSLHSVSVERLRRLDEGLDARVRVGRVEAIRPHPNADRLRLVSVELGKGQRVDVVCGGTNLREGMLVAYAPAGARVAWHGQGEPVELKPTEIRGVRSDGMICAASEIGLGEWFGGKEKEILDCSPLLSGVHGQVSGVGKPLAATLGLDDVMFDVEVTTNRPDVMSVLGCAREVAAITGARVRAGRATGIKNQTSNIKTSQRHNPDSTIQIHVRVADAKACPRYGAAVIDGVQVGPSPWWVQRRLLAAGLRPINNVVDVTNYVMLETGQPLHSFDAARLRRGNHGTVAISVRRASKGASLRALDGQTYRLTPEHLVIADAEQPIALAGIIGGEETGVTEATTQVVLECANFDPMVVRKGARALGIRTDAAARFEKGLQSEGIDGAMARCLELLGACTGGTASRPVIVGTTPARLRAISFDLRDAQARIGMPLRAADVQHALTALGCTVTKKTPGAFSVTPPWWRRGDLEASHDLVEEVARLHGYHRLPSILPTGVLPAASLPPQAPHTPFDVEQRCREVLADLGATEVMAYALTSRATIETCGYRTDQCVTIENPLSEEFALLRPSLVPTLLPIVAANQEHAPKAVVFEMGNVYIPKRQAASAKPQAVPVREEMRLLIAAYGRLMGGGHVEKLKGIVERMFAALGVTDVVFRRSEQCAMPSGVCLWHPGRTTDVVIDGTLAGVLGEVHPAVTEAAGVDVRVAVAELDWAAVLAACGQPKSISSPPPFPSVKRDVALVVDRTTPYADVAAVLAAFDPLLVASELFDTFEGGSIPAGKKSMAFHLEYRSSDRTLRAEEVEAIHTKLEQSLRQRFGAEIRA